jgi:hypothetical protein
MIMNLNPKPLPESAEPAPGPHDGNSSPARRSLLGCKKTPAVVAVINGETEDAVEI